jgi:tRNA(Ile)-lysidine synthase
VTEYRAGRFVFYRECGREALLTLRLKAGLARTWDHRFAVEAGPGLPGGLVLGPLGEDGRRFIGAATDKAPAAALAALPAVRRGAIVLAVPSLGYFANGGKDLPLRVRPVLDVRLVKAPLFPDFGGGA